MSNFTKARGSRVGLGVIGAALIAAVATPAIAGDDIAITASSATTRIVNIADLNLASSDGMAIANRRVAFAARDVCGATSIYNMQGKVDYLNCRSDALKGARHQLEQRMAAGDVSAVRVTAG